LDAAGKAGGVFLCGVDLYNWIDPPYFLSRYEGTDVKSLRRSFEEAVDDYLLTCAEQRTEPEQAFKGTFNIRVGSGLHQRVALEATRRGVSLNKYIVDILEKETIKRKIA
jgi:predicted HicB family RNase H-like nuclease